MDLSGYCYSKYKRNGPRRVKGKSPKSKRGLVVEWRGTREKNIKLEKKTKEVYFGQKELKKAKPAAYENLYKQLDTKVGKDRWLVKVRENQKVSSKCKAIN